MGNVVAGGTVSLDGYIAGPNGWGFEHLFLLDGPDLFIEGSRVTHLRYQVRRS